MGYYQMIFHYGEKRFVKKCKEVGVDGLIVVDLPWPDNKKFCQTLQKKLDLFYSIDCAYNNKKDENDN